MTAKKGMNNIDVRKENQKKIWDCILETEEISNKEIAQNLGLTFPTVNQSIQYFLEKGLLFETGKQESTGGRKPKLYKANLDKYYSIGLDITKNHVNISIVDLSGKVRYNSRIQKKYVHSSVDTLEYATFLSELVDTTIDQQVKEAQILGVGISVPGIVNSSGEVLLQSHILEEKNVPISYYNASMKYPSFMINDANAGGFAELRAHKELDNVVFFSLSNSVGGSIYIGNQTIYGNNMQSGEIGHMCIHPNGKECYCGKKGCLDAYCAAHLLSDLTHGSLEAFFLQVEENPEFAKIWDAYLSNLAIAINNAKMVLDVNVIVGGYVGSYMEPYLPILRERVRELCTFDTDGSFILATKHKVEAASIGAALHFIDAFVNQL